VDADEPILRRRIVDDHRLLGAIDVRQVHRPDGDAAPLEPSESTVTELVERASENGDVGFDIGHVGATGTAPNAETIATAVGSAAANDVIVVVTSNATGSQSQQNLVNALLVTGKPVMLVATRNPYDIAALAQTQTYIASYSRTKPSMQGGRPRSPRRGQSERKPARAHPGGERPDHDAVPVRGRHRRLSRPVRGAAASRQASPLLVRCRERPLLVRLARRRRSRLDYDRDDHDRAADERERAGALVEREPHHTGPSTTSSSVMRPTCAAGINRAPMVSSAKPSPI
jgi:hypothetical protein